MEMSTVECNPDYCTELNSYCPSNDFFCFPQRAITFSAGEILVNQSIAHVGLTLWDSEVILSHFIDSTFTSQDMEGISCAELGAGLGMAGILAAKLGCCTLVFQELPDVIEYTKVQSHCTPGPATLAPLT